MLTHFPNFRRYGVSVVAGLSLLLCACSHAEPPPQMPEAAAKAPEQGPAQPGYLLVSQNIRTKCGMPETPADSPLFDFDEAALRPRGEGILDSLATCMRDGTLKGQGVSILGHTDPRGGDDYNHKLGLARANAARDYLIAHGVSSASLNVKSRGEKDAVGTESSSWQLDRRVEIEENLAVGD